MNELNQSLMLKDLKNNKFLALAYKPNTLTNATTVKFSGTDDESTYLRHLKDKPADWHYRTKEVSYKLNSCGYRTQEFNTINWKDSVVLFGCSNVFGVGLAEDETVSHFIKLKTGRPTVNLGAPGSSMFFSYINSLILNRGYPTPFAVINVWTSYERISIFDKAHVTHHGVWKHTDEFKIWNQTEINPLMYAKTIQLSSRALWEDKTRYFEGSFFSHTSKDLECANFNFVDYARDIRHPGRGGAEAAADQIIRSLQL